MHKFLNKTYRIFKWLFLSLSFCLGALNANTKTVNDNFQRINYDSAKELVESDPEKSLIVVDKLLNSKEIELSKKNQSDLLFLKAKAYVNLEQENEAFELADTIINLYQQADHKASNIEAYLFFSKELLIVGKSKEAFSYLNEAIRIAKNHKDPHLLLEVNLVFSRYYLIAGNFDKGLESIIEAKGIIDTIGSDSLTRQLVRVHSTLGIIYGNNDEAEKSISHFNKGIEISEESGENYLLGTLHVNLGICYQNDNKIEKAEYHLKKSVEISLESNEEKKIIDAEARLGDFYLAEKDYEKAIPILKKSIKYFKKINDTGDLAYSLGSLGIAELATQNHNAGLNHLKEADELIATTDIEIYKKTLYKIMANGCYKNGFYKQGYDYFKKHIEVKDKIYSKKNQEKILELSAELETKEKEREIAALKIEKTERDQMFYISILVGLLLCMLIGFLIFSYNLILKRNKALNAAKESAELLANSKTEFLATMSHEIRTPMNGVIGMANILAEENPRPDQKENLEILKFSADNLLNLINDILDLSKIDSGNIILEQTSFDLQNHFKKLFSIFKNSNKKTNVELKLDLQLEGLEKQVVGDTLRLNQVITNLINNALKFTKEGSVSLKIKTINQVTDKAKIRFEVIDTGIGISKENQKSIFEKYQQAENETARKYGGTGLGLNIAKEIIEIHGGNLQLESEIGIGSKFFFEIDFPLSEEVIETSIQSKLSNGINDLTGLKVLLAEDNKVNQMVAKRLLKKWGINLMIAENGVEAVGLFKANNFDLILMDIQMPKMDGFEATKWIRKLPNGNLPIYSMTASTFSTPTKKEDKALMDGHIGKPFNPDQLFGLLSKHAPKKEIAPVS